jgi:hypothetical protein
VLDTYIANVIEASLHPDEIRALQGEQVREPGFGSFEAIHEPVVVLQHLVAVDRIGSWLTSPTEAASMLLTPVPTIVTESSGLVPAVGGAAGSAALAFRQLTPTRINMTSSRIIGGVA